VANSTSFEPRFFDSSRQLTFTVPKGVYSYQLLKGGQVIYESVGNAIEVNFAGTLVPSLDAVLALGGAERIRFNNNSPCAALAQAAEIALWHFGASYFDLEQKAQQGGYLIEGADGFECQKGARIDGLANVLDGPYPRRTFLGNVSLSIASPTPTPPKNVIHDLATSDLKKGFADVIVTSSGLSFVACGIDKSEELILCEGGLQDNFSSLESVSGFYRVLAQLSSDNAAGKVSVQWKDSADKRRIKLIGARLALELKAVKYGLEKRISELHPVFSSAPGMGFLQQQESFYKTVDVLRLVGDTQADLGGPLKDPSLEPLRIYVNDKIKSIQVPSEPKTPIDMGLAIINELRRIVSNLGNLSNDLSVDLRFATEPISETDGSKLVLNPCHECPEVFSQGGVRGLFRGKYYYSVTRAGYMPYSGTLDLVEEPTQALVCKLAPSTTSEKELGSHCSPEEK
jgi:hypothetical protein